MMSEILLKVPYFSQRDSQTVHAHRMCFASCCAMLLEYMKPQTLKGRNGDDIYLQRVFKYGDTVHSTAQIQALRSFGLKAEFYTNLNWQHIDNQLVNGIPVPIGILHHGPVAAPRGGGHWILIIGRTADGRGYYVHDPYGDLNLVTGGYISSNGQRLVYSKKNLDPRWRVSGQPGWGIIARK